jgi:hypothetical protein
VDDKHDGEAGHGRGGALAALREVANDADLQKQYGIAVASFEREDYEELIALAWRYQFDDDRSKFKRDIRALQEHVSEGILGRLELGE